PDVDVHVCYQGSPLDQHGVMKGDGPRRVEFGDGAGPLAGRSGVEICGTEANRIRHNLTGLAERIRARKPPTVVRHVRDQLEDGFWSTINSSRESRLRSRHRPALDMVSPNPMKITIAAAGAKYGACCSTKR